MGQYFFDAVALAKIYMKTGNYEVLQSIFENRENEIFISDLTPVELAEILNEMRENHEISDVEMKYVLKFLSIDIYNRLIMRPYYDESIETAVNLVVNHRISAIAAIQLAIALGIFADLVFVSTSRDLCAAAQAEGLKVLNPED